MNATATANAPVIPDRGVDRDPGARPGVPMERAPRPVGRAREMPPARGTAQPLRGMSGVLRRAAYRIPEHEARHWALLLFADRVDAVEHGAWRAGAIAAAIGLGLAVVAGYGKLRRR